MTEPLTVQGSGPGRLILYPPTDPYGDGYVARLRVELHDHGLVARTTVTIDGNRDAMGGLAAFLRQLADDWRGWPGQRSWAALEHEMTVQAAHDGRAHVTLEITVRQHRKGYAADSWSATILLTVEAGEQLSALARDVAALPPTSSQAAE